MTDGVAQWGADATRPAEPVAWPGGARSALTLGFDMDDESVVLTADARNRERLSVMSHQAYGAVTGMPRILSMLDRLQLTATFFCPGYTAERYPELLRRVRDAGHEIAHHGYLHEDIAGMTPRQEADVIDRGLDALERVAGVRPVGYRAPMWETTYATAGLLLDRGLLYDSSLMDSDLPYELAEHPGDGARSIVEIPVSWSLDDWEQYAYLPGVFGSGLIEDPAKALSMWTAELTESNRAEGCMALTAHPFLSGRLGRLRMLEELIVRAKELGDVWISSAEQIARHTRALHLAPRSFPQPQL